MKEIREIEDALNGGSLDEIIDLMSGCDGGTSPGALEEVERRVEVQGRVIAGLVKLIMVKHPSPDTINYLIRVFDDAQDI